MDNFVVYSKKDLIFEILDRIAESENYISPLTLQIIHAVLISYAYGNTLNIALTVTDHKIGIYVLLVGLFSDYTSNLSLKAVLQILNIRLKEDRAESKDPKDGEYYVE